MKYRKKPVVIDAIQWTGKNFDEIKKFGGKCIELRDDELIIKTLEDGKNGQAVHAATVGDFIIRGIQGEYYFCKPDIFEATYETAVPKPTYIVTVKYLHDMDIENRRIYIGKDPAKANEAFITYQELWDSESDDETVPNPFNEGYDGCGFYAGDERVEISGKDAQKYLSMALDDAIANNHDFTITPENVGLELDFDVCPCYLEVITKDL